MSKKKQLSMKEGILFAGLGPRASRVMEQARGNQVRNLTGGEVG